MKNYKPLVFSLLSIFFISIPQQVSAHANEVHSVNDFEILKFSAVYNLNNEHPQGKLVTTETIELDFKGQNQGIERAIPTIYGNENTNPKVLEVTRDGENEPYITYQQGESMIVRIGVRGQYITGKHIYNIIYSVENVIRFYESHDELYWDVNGTGWLQTFLEVNAKVQSGTILVEPYASCFTGRSGSTEKNCEVETQSSIFKVKTTEELGENENLTIIGAYEKGYFTPLSWWDKNWKYVLTLIPVMLQIYILSIAYKKWKKYGKDSKPRTTSPFFGRPKNVSVMQAGYVAENRLTTNQITAAILDLSIRGYLKIIESNDKKPKHEIVMLKREDDNLSDDETLLINELFDSSEIGTTLKLEDKKNKMFSVINKLSKLLDTQTSQKGYYDISPKQKHSKFGKEHFLGVVAIILGAISIPIVGPIAFISGVIVFTCTIMIGSLMTKRSQEGVYLQEHMNGLNLYLKTAEKDRIAAHDAVAAPLSKITKQPKRDVKFFEKLLPFAVIYGVEKSWAQAFEGIYTQPPDWYSGNWNTFNTSTFANSIASANKATSNAFSAPSSSSGSGFSGGGGGFSGGGGGGGGGGGW